MKKQFTNAAFKISSYTYIQQTSKDFFFNIFYVATTMFVVSTLSTSVIMLASLIFGVFTSTGRTRLATQTIVKGLLLFIILLTLSNLNSLYSFYKEPLVLKTCITLNVFLVAKVLYGIVLYYDFYALHFSTLTCLIGCVAIIYSFSYMKDDVFIERFIHLIFFFILSMLTLIYAGNYMTLVLGWELIGVTSFFLINFWYSRVATHKAALKAFFFNKLSDAGLLVFIIYNVFFYKSHIIWNNNIFFENILLVGTNKFTTQIVLVAMLLAAFCKSAQIGVHTWLPDSMEAPVPASALIHSATLVSAGIYIIGRNSVIINNYLPATCLFAAATAAYGGIIACCQTDLKKILAYSTISHCGFLICIALNSTNNVLYLYLYVHGFFKAFCFMCVGNILHTNGVYQDYRRFSSTKNINFDFFVLPVLLLNLASLPCSLGFYSKALFFANTANTTHTLYIFIYLGAIASIIYTTQIFYRVYFEVSKSTSLPKLRSFSPLKVNLFLPFLVVTLCFISLFFYNYIIVFWASVPLKNVFLVNNYSHQIGGILYYLIVMLAAIFFKFQTTGLFSIIFILSYVLF